MCVCVCVKFMPIPTFQKYFLMHVRSFLFVCLFVCLFACLFVFIFCFFRMTSIRLFTVSTAVSCRKKKQIHAPVYVFNWLQLHLKIEARASNRSYVDVRRKVEESAERSTSGCPLFISSLTQPNGGLFHVNDLGLGWGELTRYLSTNDNVHFRSGVISRQKLKLLKNRLDSFRYNSSARSPLLFGIGILFFSFFAFFGTLILNADQRNFKNKPGV